MVALKKFKFQQFAVDSLFEKVSAVWVSKPEKLSERYVYMVAPTGSGKTVMIGELLQRLTDLGTQEGLENRCFIWLTPRPLLAKQSKRSLERTYNLNCQDFDDNVKELKNNEIFFCNWELLKTGNYGKDDRDIERHTFWKMLDNTKEHRDVILLIDEAHFGVATEKTDNLIQNIDPAVVVNFSATLETEAVDEDRTVLVSEESVVEEGLITKSINIQTEDEIMEGARKTGDDVTRRGLFLEIAKQRREELLKAYKKEKTDINPLVLIQLPNEMKEQEKEGVATERERQAIKESEYYKYLIESGVDEKHIAIWLSEEKQNLERGKIEQNNSEVAYLFFKMAIATGWDCPRAKILVVFRNTSSKPFKIQTIGRIRRMPDRKHYKNKALNVSYVYTEYNKADSDLLELIRKQDIEPVTIGRPHLKYQDADEIDEVLFQDTLRQTFSNHFSDKKNLDEYGINTTNPNPSLMILKDKKSKTVRDFNVQLPLWEREDVPELSRKRMLMQEEYNEECERILSEQHDDFALNYSFDKIAPNKLKRALNSWIRERTGENDTDKINLIVLQELQNSGTVFRKLIRQSITAYAKESGDKQKKKEIYEEYSETIELPPEHLTYFNVGLSNGKYKNFKQCNYTNFAFTECYLNKSLTDPEKEFILRILVDTPEVGWWYKQKDFGDSVFGVKYYDTNENVDRIFYPDFIFKTTKDKLFIVDTKQGQTAKSTESADKAKGLYDYIQKKKKVDGLELIGGIAVQSGYEFMLHRTVDYKYNMEDIAKGQNGWENIANLL